MIAIYARQSVERENSISIDTQLEYCRNSLKLSEKECKLSIYRDEGVSGKDTNRPEFQRMMRDIRQGKISKVIAYKLDRISRSFYDYVGILKTFDEYGVEFVSAQESFDFNSTYGKFILNMLIIFAELERESIVTRVRDAYDTRTDKGIYMGGRRQYGFELADTVINGIKTKRYQPIADEVKQVQYIFEMYAQENVSLRRILNNLVENGIKPLSGTDWTTAKLSNLIRNPVYVKADSDVYRYFESRGVRIIDPLEAFDGTKGIFLYGKTKHDISLDDWSDMKIVLGQHEGIISSDIWLRCQHKVYKNKKLGTSISNQTSWLAGKLICAQCGHTMTTIKSRKKDGSNRRYFVCTGKTHKKTCDGINGTIYAQDIEKIAEDFISEKLKTFGIMKRDNNLANEKRRNELKLKLLDIELNQKKLGNQLINSELNSDLIALLNAKATELSNQRKLILDEINELAFQEDEIDLALFLSQHWENATFEQKKSVCNILIDKIKFYRDGTPEFIWNI